MKQLEKKVVIIGAGITGLTAAYFLKKKGVDFIVLEKSDHTGGVISTKQEEGFIYETGPNTGVLSQPDTVELINEMNPLCEIEIANAAAKKRWIWKGDSWQALPSGLKAAIKTPLFTTNDKFRILGEPFRSKGKNPDETLKELVLRRMGKSFLDYAIDPFILGIYSGDPSYLVTRYALPKLYNLEQKYGSFIGGAIRKGFEKKEERAKLASGEVFSIKGGLSKLISALVEKIGDESILLNVKDLKINPSKEGSDKTNSQEYITKGIVNQEEIVVRAEYVISSTGSFELPALLPFLSKKETDDLNNLLYAKVLQASIGFKEWKGIELDAFGGLVPFKENRDVLGILFMSSFLNGRAPEGGALLSIFMGGVRKPNLSSLPDEEVIRILEKEVKAMTGLKEFNPDLLKITRYTHAIPQYGITSGERFKTVENLKLKYPRLIIGGNLWGGIGMSDRIKQGKELAERVL